MIDDNLYAGVAMARRTQYQGGCFLPRDTQGCVSTGLTGTTGILGTETPLKPDEVIIPGHGLSHWKQKDRPDKLKEFLLDNAAAYKFTHDQALLYANEGYNLTEIGNYFKIPDEISRVWYVRPHYGNYTFNARGVY